MYNYHQLVSVLFSLLDRMSLNKNDVWYPFTSRFELDGCQHTEIFSPDDWTSWHWNMLYQSERQSRTRRTELMVSVVFRVSGVL